MKLVLASGSAAQAPSLTMCRYDYEIIVSNANGLMKMTRRVLFVLFRFARRKACFNFRLFAAGAGVPVIKCDSGSLLFKRMGRQSPLIIRPKDAKEVHALSMLSGKTSFFTGVSSDWGCP